MLATRYAGRVDALECWNEPNQWAFLYWFLAVDYRLPGRPADRGVYTGLCRTNGSHKPSWSAFQAL